MGMRWMAAYPISLSFAQWYTDMYVCTSLCVCLHSLGNWLACKSITLTHTHTHTKAHSRQVNEWKLLQQQLQQLKQLPTAVLAFTLTSDRFSHTHTHTICHWRQHCPLPSVWAKRQLPAYAELPSQVSAPCRHDDCWVTFSLMFDARLRRTLLTALPTARPVRIWRQWLCSDAVRDVCAIGVCCQVM